MDIAITYAITTIIAFGLYLIFGINQRRKINKTVIIELKEIHSLWFQMSSEELEQYIINRINTLEKHKDYNQHK